jgi:hypothetical protein
MIGLPFQLPKHRDAQAERGLEGETSVCGVSRFSREKDHAGSRKYHPHEPHYREQFPVSSSTPPQLVRLAASRGAADPESLAPEPPVASAAQTATNSALIASLIRGRVVGDFPVFPPPQHARETAKRRRRELKRHASHTLPQGWEGRRDYSAPANRGRGAPRHLRRIGDQFPETGIAPPRRNVKQGGTAAALQSPPQF